MSIIAKTIIAGLYNLIAGGVSYLPFYLGAPDGSGVSESRPGDVFLGLAVALIGICVLAGAAQLLTHKFARRRSDDN